MVHAGMFMENAANAEETVLSGYFTIEMPAIMGVMTALLMAFILGLGMAVIKGNTMKTVMNEFAEIIDKLVSNIVIPLLPFHVYGIFAKLAYAGTIVEIMGSFIKVFAMILVLHWVIIVFQYTVAGSAAKKNPFALIKNMLPAYTTAIGTQSSAATIPVTTQCTKNNGVSDGMAEFVPPVRYHSPVWFHHHPDQLRYGCYGDDQSVHRLRQDVPLHSDAGRDHGCCPRRPRRRCHGCSGYPAVHAGLR